MREFRLFAITDDDLEEHLEVKAIHEESGYRALRQALAEQYNLGTREPNIQVYNVNRRGDRSLTLRHFAHQRRPLGDSVDEMLRHIRRLWGFTVRLETVDDAGTGRSHRRGHDLTHCIVASLSAGPEGGTMPFSWLRPSLCCPRCRARERQYCSPTTLDSLRESRTLAIDGVPLLIGVRARRVLCHSVTTALAWSRSGADRGAACRLVEAERHRGLRPRGLPCRDPARAESNRVHSTGLQESARIAADLQLSDVLLRYAHHTRYGKLDPVAINRKWNDRAYPCPPSD
jgi:hypothetical protein